MTSTTIRTPSTTAATLKGDDTYSVSGISPDTGSLTVAAVALTWSIATPQSGAGVVVTNSGTIRSTGGRVFDTTGTATGATSFTVNNLAGGSIIAATDVMRVRAGIGGGSITFNNAGTITAGTNTASTQRVVNIQEYATVAGVAGLGSFVFTNAATGTVTATDDVLRVTTATAGSDATVNPVFTGTIAITNLGLIRSIGLGTSGAGAGQGLDFADVNGTATRTGTAGIIPLVTTSVTITNGSATNSTATISSTDNDAVRPGNNGQVINYGTIHGYQATSSSTDPTYQGSSAGIAATANETIYVTNEAGALIEGAKSGIFGSRNDAATTAPVTSSTVYVNNLGTIIGDNGKAVGSDYGTVQNSGLISGRANPSYARGDGDGIDINFTATIVNTATGTIEAIGADGYDDNGRKNISDGLAIGGGSVDNAGLIHSIGNGVTVNNDSNPDGSRSGNAALNLINEATGTIQADGGYAIRSENKAGADQTAANFDNDTVVNYGTIISTGTIPSTAPVTIQTSTTTGGVTTYQYTTPDPNTVGTVDGVTYTSANAGSSRFILGDGSAIQLGEGNDTLSNYGVITATDGLAINLEGGNDTLNLFTGSSITGRIDGGTGFDTLNLGLGSATSAGTLTNVIDFEQLNVTGGSWTLGDAQSYTAISLAGGSLELAAAGAGGTATITFTAAGTLKLDAAVLAANGTFANAIAGFSATSVLDLTGINFATGATATYDPTSGVLLVSSGGVTANLTLTGLGATGFSVTDDGSSHLLIQELPCFAEGTAILTPTGPRPIETLAVGEQVVTRDGTATIRWIGQRHVRPRHHASPVDAMPVRIPAGAFGAAQPARDLLLSPEHAVYLPDMQGRGGLLVPARALIGRAGIASHDIAEVTYRHILCDRHEIVFAEGLACESLLDPLGVIGFDTETMPADNLGFLAPYAPRVSQGPRLETALAAALSAPLTA